MFAPDLTHAVPSADLDLAIIAQLPSNPLLTLVPLRTAALNVVMSNEHPPAEKQSLEIKKLCWAAFLRKRHVVRPQPNGYYE